MRAALSFFISTLDIGIVNVAIDRVGSRGPWILSAITAIVVGFIIVPLVQTD